MDYQKKKMLTQSVAFMQANLNLTPDFLLKMKNSEVLTNEEISTVQKDDTSSGKVLELVCLLKRKDNRTYTRFLHALEDLGCRALVNMFKTKQALSEGMKPDPRTVHYLEHQLGGVTINPKKIQDLAVNVVLKEIYKDEVNNLQERLLTLQRQLAKATPSTCRMNSSDSDDLSMGGTGGGRGSRGDGRGSAAAAAAGDEAGRGGEARWSGSGGSRDELVQTIRQKDDAIKKKEEEYSKLRQILEDTQNDLQSVLDLNNQYLMIISQLNQMQLLAGQTTARGGSSGQADELERQLEESNAQVEMLQTELQSVTSELETTENDLTLVLQRERKFKQMLDLTEEADEGAIDARIQEIKFEGSMRRTELDKVRSELSKTYKSRQQLQEKVINLEREKEKVEFHLRQQELTIKKMKRMQPANNTIQAAEALLALQNAERQQNLRLPHIERPASQLSIASNKPNRAVFQYCMFCRQEYQPLKSQRCRIHIRPIRNGRWMCCKDESNRAAGCLEIPHFYIELTVDKRAFITDGAKFMEIG